MPRSKKIETVFFSVLQQNPDIPKIKKIASCFNSSDWQDFYAFVCASEVFPCFYSKSAELKLNCFPDDLMNKLRNIFILNLGRNILLEQELFRIAGYFRDHRCQLAPLKGPTLARQIYGDLALRQASCDLDLLVRPEDFWAAQGILEQMGYVYRGDEAVSRSYKLKYSAQLSFAKNIPGLGAMMVELHSDLRNRFAYAPLEYFWNSLSETQIEGNSILSPTKESLLVYLSFNAMANAEFGGIKYLHDLYRLVVKSGNDLNWDGILGQIKAKRGVSCVYFALALSEELFGSGAPKSFIKAIKPGAIKNGILRIWLNRNNLLYKKRDKLHNLYYFNTFWQYFASSYLYALNFVDCFKIVKDKIFLPAESIRELYRDSSIKQPVVLYLKRVAKPLTRIFRRK